MGVHWVELPFEEDVLPKRVERGHVTRRGELGMWYVRRASWGQSPADGGPFRRRGSARGLGVGRNGVVEGKSDSGGGGCRSMWLVWRSWESRGCVVAENGGGDGGGG